MECEPLEPWGLLLDLVLSYLQGKRIAVSFNGELSHGGLGS